MRTATVRDAPAAWTFSAIGTTWRISTASALQKRLRETVAELIEDFDATWSRFRLDSLVTRVAGAHRGVEVTIPSRDTGLMDLYDRLVAATRGAVDPLVGRDLELLGYDADYRLVPDHAGLAARQVHRWTCDVHRAGSTLRTDRPVVIDVGAAGKGWLVDLVADVLEEAGIDEFLIDASGDLRHRGTTPAIIGLEHPDRPGRLIGGIPLQNASLCASSTRRRAWGDGLHHVLDGRTRRPQHDVLATWVIADDTATADGLATALMVAEPDRLASFGADWLRILTDGRVQQSDRFPADLPTRPRPLWST